MTFQELGLTAPIIQALTEMDYRTPTPIQEKAIPPALAGRDVLGCAQTGTGKTCAFAAPILQRLSAGKRVGRPVRALILTPTRELALQIQENIELYAKHLSLRSAVIFGGVGQQPQVDALRRGTDILVATPGRLMDLYQQKEVALSHLEIFVLDEADRMLDMGFIHDVRKILGWLPEKKQTMLFSATMPPEIAELVNSLLRNPVRVAVDPISSPVKLIRQSIYFVDQGNKTRLLAWLLEQQKVKNALVFTRTKHGANKVTRDLEKLGVSAAAIHGNKSQTARQQALADFKAGKVTVLVATDIAARGLDIEELSHVFNYNLPEVPETYVHRIGRTGRAGHGGCAIALCDYTEQPLLRAIEKLIGFSVPVVEDHPWPMVVLEAPKRDKNGRIINAEDAEARAAAREKNAQRRAAQKEKEPPKEPPRPSAAAPESGLSRPARPKPVRPGTRLDNGSAMPVVEFTKPDPLAGDHIMDATARLLAPRGGGSAPTPADGGKKRRRSRHGRGKSAVQTAPDPAAVKKTEKPPVKKGEKKPDKSAAKAEPGKNAQSGSAKGKSGKNASRRGGRRPAEPQRSHTKDSTEQPSLMKPFYLSRD